MRLIGFSLTCAICATALAALAQQPLKVSISGRVIDEQQKPVARVVVQLIDSESHKEYSDKTDKDGDFVIEHPVLDHCSLRAEAQTPADFTEVLIKTADGKEDTHVLITLKRGFKISGHVLGNGHPTKGLTVQVEALDGDTVHGGGTAFTDSHGAYWMFLTPGTKAFRVLDNKRAVLATEKLSVQHEGTARDMVLQESTASTK